ncbi:hypothetical protein BO71DRAFT_33806 [Aspergillus ellipticus CBS 707.79]|uniref:Uncharacterized protein n=1 Tax=Aspergillus ellipticus CBS 707.79 TaxID=1448320 RepID=A0A319DMU4_9EURO|nr:hypothetical protein BO71DRAFT_33806 [Aspergillus ellipticus CBS 707.79]
MQRAYSVRSRRYIAPSSQLLVILRVPACLLVFACGLPVGVTGYRFGWCSPFFGLSRPRVSILNQLRRTEKSRCFQGRSSGQYGSRVCNVILHNPCITGVGKQD